MSNLFRERFQGHEAPVDPATWQVIEARLLTSAPASDPVNELFKERFQHHEVNVDPGVWQGISSQLGHGAAAGGSLLGGYGWVAAGLAGVVAVGALVFALNQGDGEAAPAQQVASEPALTEQVSLAQAQEAIEENEGASVSAAMEVGVASESNTPSLSSSPTGKNPGATPVGPAGLDLAMGADQPASEASDPQLVELIITDLSEQVIKEVEAEQRTVSGDQSPARSRSVNDPESLAPPTEAAADEPPVKLYLPNVFSPNGDGINDTYQIEPKNGFASTLVRVYSMKTNQLVFSSTGLDQEWTGANCEDGMYMVAVEAITLDGRVVSEGKVVWLNRNSMN